MSTFLNVKIVVLLASLLMIVGAWLALASTASQPINDNTLRDADRAARHATLKAAGIIKD